MIASDPRAKLDALYAQLPKLECLGRCAHSCREGIDMSAVERQRIAEAGHGIPCTPVGSPCPALTFMGTCSVYEIRPMVCRLWGIASSMPCPHGCMPEGGWLPDREASRFILRSMLIGGHRAARSVDEAERMLEMWDDPSTAELLARYLRGDRGIERELARRAQEVRLSLVRPG